jgi:light-regulated signal transduction histidine kinase (bacteriophytochrome)
MGMDEKTLNNLFTYSKSKDNQENEQEGTQLGLILSKEFLDKNEATVDVSSKLGEGTKFTISI